MKKTRRQRKAMALVEQPSAATQTRQTVPPHLREFTDALFSGRLNNTTPQLQFLPESPAAEATHRFPLPAGFTLPTGISNDEAHRLMRDATYAEAVRVGTPPDQLEKLAALMDQHKGKKFRIGLSPAAAPAWPPSMQAAVDELRELKVLIDDYVNYEEKRMASLTPEETQRELEEATLKLKEQNDTRERKKVANRKKAAARKQRRKLLKAATDGPDDGEGEDDGDDDGLDGEGEEGADEGEGVGDGEENGEEAPSDEGPRPDEPIRKRTHMVTFYGPNGEVIEEDLERCPEAIVEVVGEDDPGHDGEAIVFGERCEDGEGAVDVEVDTVADEGCAEDAGEDVDDDRAVDEVAVEEETEATAAVEHGDAVDAPLDEADAAVATHVVNGGEGASEDEYKAAARDLEQTLQRALKVRSAADRLGQPSIAAATTQAAVAAMSYRPAAPTTPPAAGPTGDGTWPAYRLYCVPASTLPPHDATGKPTAVWSTTAPSRALVAAPSAGSAEQQDRDRARFERLRALSLQQAPRRV